MEFLSITKQEIPGTSGHNSNICRICLQKNHNSLVSLFDKHKFLSSTIASVVFYVAGVEILRNDLYPQFICNECLSNIQNAAEIKKKCIESDLKLKSNWLHPEFELKQEKEDVDDYYDQNDIADSYNDESEFMDFPKISVEPIEVKTEKKEVKEDEESDEEYLPAKCKKAKPKFKVKSRTKTTNAPKKPAPKRKNEKIPEGNVCRNCSKIYTDKYCLKLHFKSCKDIYYFCEICRQTIKYKSNFTQHIQEHEEKGDPAIIVCDTCNVKLFTREKIKQHPCLKKEEAIKCPICKNEFQEMKEFSEHCEVHRIGEFFKCTQPNCTKFCMNAREFYYHMKSHFQPGDVCGCCGKYFIDQWQLKVHRSTHNASQIFYCDYCGDGLTRKNRLLVHMRRHLKIKPKRKRTVERICENCSKSFKNVIALKRHQIREHGATGDYQCHLCSEWLVQQSSIAKHMKSHNKPKIVCNICSLSDFKNARELKIHVELVHVRVTKHQCPTCFKSFKHPWHLNDHIKIHTGEKNFECTVCSKGFVSKSALTEHTRMHTGEMPYSCSMCPDKKYRSRNALSRHYKRYHKLTNLPKTKPENPVRSIPLASQHLEDSYPLPMTSMNPFFK